RRPHERARLARPRRRTPRHPARLPAVHRRPARARRRLSPMKCAARDRSRAAPRDYSGPPGTVTSGPVPAPCPCPASCPCPSASSPASCRSGPVSASASASAAPEALPPAWPAAAPPPVAAGTRRRSATTMLRGRPKTSASWSPLLVRVALSISAPACREASTGGDSADPDSQPRENASDRYARPLWACQETTLLQSVHQRGPPRARASAPHPVIHDQRRIVARPHDQRNRLAGPQLRGRLAQVVQVPDLPAVHRLDAHAAGEPGPRGRTHLVHG